MMWTGYFLRGLTLLWVLILAGCASQPQIKQVWKDPAYTGHPHRIMVIGMAKEPLNRRVFEDEFVSQLKSHGADALASYTFLSDVRQDNQAAVARVIEEQVPDTLLITRVVSKRSVKTVMPGRVYYYPTYYTRWRDYYRYGYEAVITPGYVSKSEFALLETNLYDAHSDKLIWAASYEIDVGSMRQKDIQPYVAAILGTMMEQGLLRP